MCVIQDAVAMKCSLFELYALKNISLLHGRHNAHSLSASDVCYNQKRGKKSHVSPCFKFFWKF